MVYIGCLRIVLIYAEKQQNNPIYNKRGIAPLNPPAEPEEPDTGGLMSAPAAAKEVTKAAAFLV